MSTSKFKALVFYNVFIAAYMSFIADEVAKVAMFHVGQDHQWRALRWKADAQQRENIGVAEVFHDDTLLQKLGNLLQVCNSCR